jgi:hypothetical protein
VWPDTHTPTPGLSLLNWLNLSQGGGEVKTAYNAGSAARIKHYFILFILHSHTFFLSFQAKLSFQIVAEKIRKQ